MDYEFSVAALFIGFIILAAGLTLLRFYRAAADSFGYGAGSYDKFKLYALIGCGVGIVVMLNLHAMFFSWFFSLLFGR